MTKYTCTVCNYVYDPKVGAPADGIAAGTAFEDIPDSWFCPLCAYPKSDFRPEETGFDPGGAADHTRR